MSWQTAINNVHCSLHWGYRQSKPGPLQIGLVQTRVLEPCLDVQFVVLSVEIVLFLSYQLQTSHMKTELGCTTADYTDNKRM